MAAVVRLEAFLRQAVADWEERPRDVAYFKELGRICAEMAGGSESKGSSAPAANCSGRGASWRSLSFQS